MRYTVIHREMSDEAPPPTNTPTDRALTGLELLKDKIRANADLSQRLRDMEASMVDLKRQSTQLPSIDPKIVEAIKKLSSRIDTIETNQKDLISALTEINNKVYDLERLIQALGSVCDGI